MVTGENLHAAVKPGAHSDARPSIAFGTKIPSPDVAAGGNVLLIAYNFPPDASSTGRLRTLGFMRHLPSFGWQPTVLTASARAYERTDANGLEDVPSAQVVRRAFALDTRRHLGWRGRYWSAMAIPDRWISWWPSAVMQGLRLIRQKRIDVIWSTYPIMTSHLIALTLHRITGLPWIADFRDPVVASGGNLSHKTLRWIEQRIVDRADRLVFTTPSAMARCGERFPQARSRGKLAVIPNGYEEEVFANIRRRPRMKVGQRTLVHAGVLYRDGRNPIPFFRALASLKADNRIDARTLRVVLRASGSEEYYQAEIDRLDIGDLLELAEPIGYKAALEEQASADGLLLFQGGQFNAQIPAKVYEYLRLGVPIFALTDSAGDTAAVLRDTGGAHSAPMEDETKIATALENFLQGLENGTLTPAEADVVQNYSRDAGAEKLARHLNEVTRELRSTENG